MTVIRPCDASTRKAFPGGLSSHDGHRGTSLFSSLAIVGGYGANARMRKGRSESEPSGNDFTKPRYFHKDDPKRILSLTLIGCCCSPLSLSRQAAVTDGGARSGVRSTSRNSVTHSSPMRSSITARGPGRCAPNIGHRDVWAQARHSMARWPSRAVARGHVGAAPRYCRCYRRDR